MSTPVSALVVAAALALAACSSGGDDQLASPDTTADGASSTSVAGGAVDATPSSSTNDAPTGPSVGTGTATTIDSDELAGVVEQPPVTSVPRADLDPAPDSADLPTRRDGEHRNELGELWELDELAALACADAEVALTALDEGDDPTDALASASDRAAQSDVAALASAAESLTGSVDIDEVFAFLRLCTDRGFEL